MAERLHWRKEVIPLALLFLSPFLYFWPATCERLLLALGDGITYYFPLRLMAARYISDTHLPLWTPFIFSGLSFLASSRAVFSILALVLLGVGVRRTLLARIRV